MQTLIVLPTYDERENLPRVIDALAAIRGQTPFEGATLLEIITKVRTVEPEDPKKYQMGIPDSLNGVVQRIYFCPEEADHPAIDSDPSFQDELFPRASRSHAGLGQKFL